MQRSLQVVVLSAVFATSVTCVPTFVFTIFASFYPADDTTLDCLWPEQPYSSDKISVAFHNPVCSGIHKSSQNVPCRIRRSGGTIYREHLLFEWLLSPITGVIAEIPVLFCTFNKRENNSQNIGYSKLTWSVWRYLYHYDEGPAWSCAMQKSLYILCLEWNQTGSGG